jgi:hypothetical protein
MHVGDLKRGALGAPVGLQPLGRLSAMAEQQRELNISDTSVTALEVTANGSGMLTV